jgi:pterin-4a-carbinolamine dehydratase
LRYAEILEACWKGYRQAGMKKKGDRQVPNCVPVSENDVRNDADNFSPNNNALDRLHHEFIPTWQILNHRVLKTAYNFADDDTALEFVQAIKQMGERMDHNGVITLDNAQVTVEVTTHDVNGLTRLDFEYALKAHDLSNKMNGDQEPHPTNSLEAIEEDLKKWFKEKWVRFGPDGKIRGDCARGSSKEGKPKCLPQSKAHALGKKGRASSAAKKRREDPNPERRGAAKNVATRVKEADATKGTGQQLSVQKLAQISDAALDSAYGYGRSSPSNTFGWQANLKSAAFAKQMIDRGITDIEAISDAIHKGWNVTAQAFVKNPMMFDDSKTMAPEKLEAKIAQRQKLMTQNYAQLPEEEKEKDRVVARAMLQAITGQQGVAEDDMDEGWKQNMAAGILGATMALSPVPARADIANMSPDQVQQSIKRIELAEKYMEVLIQRAKEDGRPLDTSTMNKIKVKATDMAIKKLQSQSSTQQQTPQSNFPKQGSERIVSPNFDKFESKQELDEKQDACYSKVKSRYKVWPSAYASGALVQCRKKGAANWGNKKK